MLWETQQSHEEVSQEEWVFIVFNILKILFAKIIMIVCIVQCPHIPCPVSRWHGENVLRWMAGGGADRAKDTAKGHLHHSPVSSQPRIYQCQRESGQDCDMIKKYCYQFLKVGCGIQNV